MPVRIWRLKASKMTITNANNEGLKGEFSAVSDAMFLAISRAFGKESDRLIKEHGVESLCSLFESQDKIHLTSENVDTLFQRTSEELKHYLRIFCPVQEDFDRAENFLNKMSHEDIKRLFDQKLLEALRDVCLPPGLEV